MALACSGKLTACSTRSPAFQSSTSRRSIPRCQSGRRYRSVARSTSVASEAETDAVAIVKACAEKPGAYPAPQLLSAMLALEKQKLPTEGWFDLLSSPRARWKLVFTADSKDVAAATKKQPNKGGIYFPIAACQKFDGTNKVFTNGVFLGPIAYLKFPGPYDMKGKQLWFDVVNMTIGIGPWSFTIPLKKDAKQVSEMDDKAKKALPFFLYAYVDETIIVGRGRGGGLALWVRPDKEWEAKSGVINAYK